VKGELSFEIIESKSIPIPLAKKLLKKRISEAEAPELIRRVYEYLSKFTKCVEDKIEELINELKKFDLDDRTIAMIASICPDTIEELRTLLVFESREIDADTLDKILEVIDKYRIKEQ